MSEIRVKNSVKKKKNVSKKGLKKNKVSRKFDFDKNFMELYEKALEVVSSSVLECEFALKSNFDVIWALSHCNKLDEAQKLIERLVKSQTRYGDFKFKKEGKIVQVEPVYFLRALCEFITQKKNTSPKILKKYIKFVRRAIAYLDKNLDENFLLIGTKKFGVIKYKAKVNAIVISFTNELSDLLNEVGYHREADSLFMLKGKLELGVSRYLWYGEFKQFLKFFKGNNSYRIASLRERFDIMSYDIFDINYMKKVLKSQKKEIFLQNDVGFILDYLFLLKQVNFKKFKIYFKEVFFILKEIPEFVQKKGEFEEYLSILKSLNPKFKLNFIELKSRNINNYKVFVRVNSVDIACKILRLA